MELTREQRSLEVICENTNDFAERNVKNRERSSQILGNILVNNEDKYKLTKKEINTVVDYYENEDDPISVYERFLKNRMPKHKFCAMVNESNVKTRAEV